MARADRSDEPQSERKQQISKPVPEPRGRSQEELDAERLAADDDRLRAARHQREQMDARIRHEAAEVERLRGILDARQREEKKSPVQQLRQEAREMADARTEVTAMGNDLYAQKSAIQA